MNPVIVACIAVVAGASLGLFFGGLQEAAARRNARRAVEGKLKSGWSLMPGSFSRIAYLLIALAAVQFLCPLLFLGGRQWWVSAGLAGGYGWMLLRQLRERLGRLPS